MPNTRILLSDANNSYTKPALGITWARMPNTRILLCDANNSYTKPALGITWARMPNTRIFLCDENQENPSQKLMKVTKSVKKVINK